MIQPPPVAEDDASITIDRPQLRRLDGLVGAYAAYPKTLHERTPGIVVAMDIWGVDPYLRHVVRRFAKAGFLCIAPDLYSRLKPPSADGGSDAAAFEPFAARLQRKQYGADLRAAALHLMNKAHGAKLGIVGFGCGGHIALTQAVDNGDIYSACAPFCGSIDEIDPSDIHMPICGSYGEKDATISAEALRAWRALLVAPSEVRIYASSGAAFYDDTRDTYVASAAIDAWKRVLAFFKEKLGSKR
jgi:carboxymethylenebutenolidase